MRNRVGTRAEAPVAEQNHTCSPMLSGSLVTRRVPAALLVMFRIGLVPSLIQPLRGQFRFWGSSAKQVITRGVMRLSVCGSFSEVHR
eukprot:2903879-Pyramimonas_sp.AAC.1